MPIFECSNGKYRIGEGECVYTSRENAEEAYQAYLASEEDRQKSETYNDYPESASNNAKRALKYKEENGSSCGTPVGWARARQLANKERISRDTIARMASFKRHQQNKDVPYDEGCGGIMWDAWGGTSGIEWAIRKLEQIDNKKEEYDMDTIKFNNRTIYNYKNIHTGPKGLTIKDVDTTKGIVTGYFSAFGVVDSDGDMMMPGAFKRSIQDWGPNGKQRVKHLFNHDPGQPLGKIMELDEDSYGLKYVSKVGTHSLGRDFIKMVESGLITEHSIGFRTLREQKGSGSNEIYDVMLFEGSSLSAWGANMETPLIGMKSEQTLKQLQDQIKSFENFIRNCDVSEETVDLCLIKVKQLAQAIEHMSSTEAAIEAPLQQKDDELEQSLINILNKI